jgi:hypothetical protein
VDHGVINFFVSTLAASYRSIGTVRPFARNGLLDLYGRPFLLNLSGFLHEYYVGLHIERQASDLLKAIYDGQVNCTKLQNPHYGFKSHRRLSKQALYRNLRQSACPLLMCFSDTAVGRS